MKTNRSEPKAYENESSAPSVDVTSAFRAAGLTQTVLATQAFEEKHHLLKPDDRMDHYDILWAVRCAVNGTLPTRPLRSPAGKAVLIQIPSFQRGTCDNDLEIVVVTLPPANIGLMLPEEFH
jgi:hypothetical protein